MNITGDERVEAEPASVSVAGLQFYLSVAGSFTFHAADWRESLFSHLVSISHSASPTSHCDVRKKRIFQPSFLSIPFLPLRWKEHFFLEAVDLLNGPASRKKLNIFKTKKTKWNGRKYFCLWKRATGRSARVPRPSKSIGSSQFFGTLWSSPHSCSWNNLEKKQPRVWSFTFLDNCNHVQSFQTFSYRSEFSWRKNAQGLGRISTNGFRSYLSRILRLAMWLVPASWSASGMILGFSSI